MKTRSTWLLVAAFLFGGALSAMGAMQIEKRNPDGSTTFLGLVTTKTVTSGVTTNTTSAAVAIGTGEKTFYGNVVCSSGACAQTQAIYGDVDSDAANGVLLCTLTLSGTTRKDDACPVVTANFAYYYVVTTATSGTAATGAVYVMY